MEDLYEDKEDDIFGDYNNDDDDPVIMDRSSRKCVFSFDDGNCPLPADDIENEEDNDFCLFVDKESEIKDKKNLDKDDKKNEIKESEIMDKSNMKEMKKQIRIIN